MARAFLSHSSKDKNLVRQIFDQLSAAKTHYDEETFDLGTRSAANIFNSLSATEIFVLFVSQHSINSPWVNSEIAIAQQKLYSSAIAGIQIFILDHTPRQELPTWLQDFVISSQSSPKRIANAIRSRLYDIEVSRNEVADFYIGREDDQRDVVRALAVSSENTPTAIYFSGPEGIGRRTLARHCLSNTYHTQLTRYQPEIFLANEQSDIDFHRQLLSLLEPASIEESVRASQGFRDLPAERKTSRLVEMLGALSDNKQVLHVFGTNAIVDDQGDFHPWLGALLNTLPSRARTQMVIFCNRMVRHPLHSQYPRVLFKSVGSLSQDTSKQLLNLWLKHLETDAPQIAANAVLDLVLGHPRQIQVAARYLKSAGAASATVNIKEITEKIRSYANAIIKSIPLTILERKLLALLAEYRYLLPSDLIEGSNLSDDEISAVIPKLRDFGLIEVSSNHLRISPFLADAVSRLPRDNEIDSFLKSSRAALVERLNTYRDSVSVSFSVIELGVLASLRSGATLPNVFDQRAILASQYLRVAREMYDQANYSLAGQLCGLAIEKRDTLTIDAQIECFRLYGMSLIRQSKFDEISTCLAELEKYREQSAKRHSEFLRGFRSRWEGKPDAAERHYKSAYALGGQRNFHILRELAHVLTLQDRYQDAEIYARRALEIAPRNPYILDTLLEILLEVHKGDPAWITHDKEVEELLEALRDANELERRNFYQLRMASYCLATRDYLEAIRWANSAIEISPKYFPGYLIRARAIMYVSGSRTEIDSELATLKKLAIDLAAQGDRRYLFPMRKLEVQMLVRRKRYAEARDAIESSGVISGGLRASLMRELAESILFDESATAELKTWASRQV
jgi:tetratricopeptide (TPR) repeat protein